MLAVVGTLLLATSAVALAWAQLLYRQPNPPRWTQWEFPTLTVTLLILASFALGLSLLGQFLATLDQQQLGLSGVGLIALFLVVGAIGFTRLRGRLKRLHAANQADGKAILAAVPAAPSESGGPEPNPTRPAHAPASGKRSRQRKAA